MTLLTRAKGLREALNANYRMGTGPQRCSNCRFFVPNTKYCTVFSFRARPEFTSDRWSPLAATTTKPGGRSPGDSIKNPRVYEALLRRGLSKERAARISNAMAASGESVKHGSQDQSTAVDAIDVGWLKIDGRLKQTETGMGRASASLIAPPVVRARALQMGSLIDPSDLHENGREKLPHITVHYGVLDDPSLVRQTVSEFGPITVKFGEASLFNRPDFDVLKVEVDSPELRRLHETLPRDGGETRPVYSPHMTIAYLKPGMGRKYTGRGPLYGRTATMDTLIFSDKNRNETAIKLGEDRAAKSFAVIKQADGNYRWVSLSSNAFRDRDQEIVSTKALAADVARADATGEYGPLRFWHLRLPAGKNREKGVDIGDCDFNWLRGRTLIESGTFRSKAVAQAVAAKTGQFQVSIGFRHPQDEPDSNGVFHNIRRFERSLVPAGRAANPFTSLSVLKENPMDNNEKLAAFKTLLEEHPAEAERILESATAAEKTADAMGIAFKEHPDISQMTADELLEYAIARKEAEEKQAAEAEKAEKGGAYSEELKGMVAELKGMIGQMGENLKRMGSHSAGRDSDDVGKAEKEDTAAALRDAANAQSARIENLEATIAELTEGLKQATATIKELRGDQPEGMSHRPTQDDSNVTGDEPAVEKNANGALPKFLDFITPQGGA